MFNSYRHKICISYYKYIIFRAWYSPWLFFYLKLLTRYTYKDIRPINLLPVLSKVLEGGIYKQINAYLAPINVIQESQSEFNEATAPNYSCWRWRTIFYSHMIVTCHNPRRKNCFVRGGWEMPCPLYSGGIMGYRLCGDSRKGGTHNGSLRSQWLTLPLTHSTFYYMSTAWVLLHFIKAFDIVHRELLVTKCVNVNIICNIFY